MTSTHIGDRGATGVEYAILLAAIAGVIIAIAGALGIATQGLFSDAQTAISAQNGG